MKKIRRLLNFLSENKERLSPLLILTHDYPDPDSLASACALRLLAERGFDIRTHIAYGGIVGRSENKEMVRILKLPVYKLRPSDFKKFPQIALVDTQPLFTNNSFPKKRKAALVLDQHPSEVKPLADFSIVDPEIGATSVLLAQALLLQGVEIPSQIATALVYGILSDTLGLYRAHKPEITHTYLRLLPLCDIGALARIQNPQQSRRFFATLVRGIQKARIMRRVIVSHLGPVESPDLVAQMADVFLTCEGIQWTFCTGRYGEHLHLSLRARDPEGAAGVVLRDIVVDKGQAGGHGHIAGGKMKVEHDATPEQWEQIEELVTGRLAAKLKIPKDSVFHSSFLGQ
jgi:nanoRNase/pAp phosphatase (c-di-AMP/oligoRNAs hydrolase)